MRTFLIFLALSLIVGEAALAADPLDLLPCRMPEVQIVWNNGKWYARAPVYYSVGVEQAGRSVMFETEILASDLGSAGSGTYIRKLTAEGARKVSERFSGFLSKLAISVRAAWGVGGSILTTGFRIVSVLGPIYLWADITVLAATTLPQWFMPLTFARSTSERSDASLLQFMLNTTNLATSRPNTAFALAIAQTATCRECYNAIPFVGTGNLSQRDLDIFCSDDPGDRGPLCRQFRSALTVLVEMCSAKPGGASAGTVTTTTSTGITAFALTAPRVIRSAPLSYRSLENEVCP